MASTAPAQKEDRVVFTAGPMNFSVRDIIDAAHFRGEVDAAWKEFLARLEAEKAAQEAGAEADEAAIESAAVEFRYRYDLITAEETERWLEVRGLTLSDFGDYFRRAYWGNISPRKTGATIPFAEASEESRELFAAELTLAGGLDKMAERLAWRVATAEAKSESSDLAAADIPEWLGGIDRDGMWHDNMRAMEATFQSACAQLLTPEAAEREIGALRLPLTRFDVETIEFESRDAASEAIWCIRNDGMTMEEVAQEGRYPYRRAELVLEDIPDDLQQKFLSLTPGSVLEPIPREDGYQLSRMLGK